MGCIVGAVIISALGGGPAGVPGPEVGGVILTVPGGLELFLFAVPVDGPDNEQNHCQPGGQTQQNQQGNGGNMCKIVSPLRLHKVMTSQTETTKRAVLLLLYWNTARLLRFIFEAGTRWLTSSGRRQRQRRPQDRPPAGPQSAGPVRTGSGCTGSPCRCRRPPGRPSGRQRRGGRR